MDILSNMKQSHFFSASEQAVIDYIFSHPSDIQSATVKELAHSTFTSPSTVIRLYQKLGCKNYSDFKVQIAAAMAQKEPAPQIDANFPFSENSSFGEITENLDSLCCDSIHETLTLIEKDQHLYEKAIELLYGTDQITIYGVGTNQSLAYDFQLNLLRINKKVSIPSNHQELMISAAYSKPSDAAIVISYTGETSETIEYCRLLHQSRTPVICITNIGNNTISDLSDVALKIVSKEKMFSKIGIFSSKYSIMLILDILYSGIFQKNYHDNINLLISKRKISTNFRSNVPPLKEDI